MSEGRFFCQSPPLPGPPRRGEGGKPGRSGSDRGPVPLNTRRDHLTLAGRFSDSTVGAGTRRIWGGGRCRCGGRGESAGARN